MIEKVLRWLEPQPAQVTPEIQQTVGGNPLVAEALMRRGINNPSQAWAFLNPSFYTSTPATELPDLVLAAERVENAIRQGEKIGVWGDFDVDGQTATAVLVAGLQMLGAQVSYHVPIRANESHGINIPFLKSFLASGIQLLLTCDTGISAADAVEFARSEGVDTIITDHHTLPTTLPRALAVINPRRLPFNHPLSTLCGVGCAFKLGEALFSRAGRLKESEQFYDLVALGSVADLALLIGDCRYLVQRGLAGMRENPRPALLEMLRLAEVKSTYLTEEHISFVLAPRLNAAGRLADANPIVEFLTTQDDKIIRQVAAELERLNSKRKLLCDQVFKGALSLIEHDRSLLETPVLLLNHPQWPAGVIGIVASRLVELYYRPVILISTPPDEAGRASARSVEGIDITAAISANQQYLLGFGGHPMAAGFGIMAERIPEFRKALSRTIESSLAKQPQSLDLAIDAYLPLENVTMDLVEDLDRLAPFGSGNPHLVFASRDLVLQSSSPIGKTGEHLQLIVEDKSGVQRRVIWWQGVGAGLPEGRFDLAYTVRSSNYRGQQAVQIEWLNARPIEETIAAGPTTTIPVLDYRDSFNPQALLTNLAQEKDLIIWGEADRNTIGISVDRYHLKPAATLVIWSIPPGRAEMNFALQTVLPRQVILFGNQPGSDQIPGFLSKLAGLILYAINNRQGKVSISELAAACAHREITIRKGIEWFVSQGQIDLVSHEGLSVELAKGDRKPTGSLTSVEGELKYLLQETAAFRSYYMRTEPGLLIRL